MLQPVLSNLAINRRALAVTAMQLPYVAETQLSAPVSCWLDQQVGVVAVAEEVDVRCGIADLVAVRNSNGVLPTRPVIGDHLQLRLLQECVVPRTESQLRAWSPYGWRGLLQRSVRPLLADGLLVEGVDADGDTVYETTLDVSDPFTGLVAVELKLHDWRRAVAQSGKYRLFAETSYVAMPDMRITPSLTAAAVKNQIGVLAVGADGTVTEVHPAPTRAALQPQRRRWASEAALNALRCPGGRAAGSPML